jgi:hypothetical protein
MNGMRSDQQRIDAYNAGVAPTTVSLKIAARMAQAKTNFAGATNDLVAHQLATAQVLDAAGIVGLMRGRYQAYSNRLHKITNNFYGLAATNMAQLEHDKWESVCQDVILISIALVVYGITVT